MNEEWRPIQDWPYEVSDLGRVRHAVTKRVRSLVGSSRMRYLAVDLYRAGGGDRRVYVHELVLTAFAGPRPTGNVARHRDGCHTNNRATNLAWGTISDNARDSQRHGTFTEGVRSPQSKLNPVAVQVLRYLRQRGVSVSRLALAHGLSSACVYDATNGRRWKSVPSAHRDPEGRP